jgi:3-oxoacyl-[acyl-carrier protein] reductase
LITQDIMAANSSMRLRDAALAGLGQVDILVNCAGGSRPLPVDAPEESWEEAISSTSPGSARSPMLCFRK